ncbi:MULTISPECIES: class F sortase [unclassified Knoellia]|uniref:class F sortase n=1 Tax=Knoellia altitudinis TaxID=3404795 RepID=UPI003608C68D
MAERPRTRVGRHGPTRFSSSARAMASRGGVGLILLAVTALIPGCSRDTEPPSAAASASVARQTTSPKTLTPMSFSAPTIDVSGSLTRTSAVNGVVNPPAGVLAWVTGYDRVQPGEVGTAVIAGHVVDGTQDDVFANLKDIKRGAEVTVVDARGKPVVYTVTSTRVATKEEVSRDKAVWGANGSIRRIALITCDDDDGFRADGHRVANFVAIAEAR